MQKYIYWIIITIIIIGCSPQKNQASLVNSGDQEKRPNRGEVPIDQMFAGIPLEQRMFASKEMDMTSARNIDLRRFDTGVRNQQSEGSCTAFATVAAMENKISQVYGSSYDLSEQHLWESQNKEPNMYSSVNTAESIYITDESECPYGYVCGGSGTGVATIDQAYEISSVSDVQSELAAGNPLVIGVSTSEPFVGPGGVINVHGEASGYGHAMAVVGIQYDEGFEGGGYYIIKNSWGSGLGDRGYVYMPFAYCTVGSWYCIFISVAEASVYGATPSDGDEPDDDGEDDDGEDDDGEDDDGEDDDTDTDPQSFRVDVEYQGYDEDGDLGFYFSIDASPDFLEKVRSVVYDVHGSFGEYATMVSVDSSSGFRSETLWTYANGWRTNGTYLYMKDGTVRRLRGSLIEY